MTGNNNNNNNIVIHVNLMRLFCVDIKNIKYKTGGNATHPEVSVDGVDHGTVHTVTNYHSTFCSL